MTGKILNFIIIFSIIGIGVIVAKDYFTSDTKKQQLVSEIKAKAQKIIPTIVVKKTIDELVPCESKYFTFQKGATWTHNVSLEYSINGQKAKIDEKATTTIIATEESKIKIETVMEKSKEKNTGQIICKKSGIYGSPIALANTEKISEFGISLFPKNEDIKKGSSQAKIGVDLPVQLPIAIPKIGITINNKIASMSASIIKINSKIDLGNLLATDTLKEIDFMDYQLKEKTGIVSLKIDANLANFGFIKANITQLSFSLPKK